MHEQHLAAVLSPGDAAGSPRFAWPSANHGRLLLAEQPPQQLARRRAGERVAEAHGERAACTARVLSAAQAISSGSETSPARHDDRDRDLAAAPVRPPVDGGVGDRGVAGEDGLELGGRDLVARRP